MEPKKGMNTASSTVAQTYARRIRMLSPRASRHCHLLPGSDSSGVRRVRSADCMRSGPASERTCTGAWQAAWFSRDRRLAGTGSERACIAARNLCPHLDSAAGVAARDGTQQLRTLSAALCLLLCLVDRP